MSGNYYNSIPGGIAFEDISGSGGIGSGTHWGTTANI
jgi:hypothetical protein